MNEVGNALVSDLYDGSDVWTSELEEPVEGATIVSDADRDVSFELCITQANHEAPSKELDFGIGIGIAQSLAALLGDTIGSHPMAPALETPKSIDATGTNSTGSTSNGVPLRSSGRWV